MHEQEDDQRDGQILIGLLRRRDAQSGTVPYRWDEDDFCPDLVVSAAEHSARGTALLKLKGENVLGKPGDVDRSAISSLREVGGRPQGASSFDLDRMRFT
ncbi:hypothetical protein LL962_00685 [Xanthomonas sp. NCPPB 1067]|uniref:hypothetical protein n=1 Tax=Xanthomonas TaxID=338 RepID=UPI001E52E59A|nr:MULTISPECIES: hypothetical protein [Xanthomonas]MCC4585640.1 hypothetical protein [Xanthomonas sp. NCPPB 1067]MCD0246215.1 hypothetical protein [Xanthomonas melonis]MCD0278291.1 hypothetical protein [Xanthomonas melonis]